MIHRERDANGSDVFHAYTLVNDPRDGHSLERLGSFSTSEAAKDAIASDLGKLMGAFEKRLEAWKLQLVSWDGEDEHGNARIDLVAAQAQDIHNDAYFLALHVQDAMLGAKQGIEGTLSLYGPAAVEYARRHGHNVTHAKFDNAGNHEFCEEVTAGRAFELLPTINGMAYLSISIPDDCKTDDLPPDVSPFDIRKLKESDPVDLREKAADARRFAKEFYEASLARAAKLEQLAAEREASVLA